MPIILKTISESGIRTGARSAQKAMHEVQTQISQAALSEASMHCFASSPAAEEPSAAGYAGQRTGAETTSPLPCLLPSNLPLPGSYLWPLSARLSHLSSIGIALILSAVQVLCKSSPTRFRQQLRMRRRQSASGGGIACTFVPPSISENRWMRRMKPQKRLGFLEEDLSYDRPNSVLLIMWGCLDGIIKIEMY